MYMTNEQTATTERLHYATGRILDRIETGAYIEARDVKEYNSCLWAMEIISRYK